VRAVSRAEARLREAAKLGFDHAILPAGGGEPARSAELRLSTLKRVAELPDLLADAGPATGAGGRRFAAACASD
ncbi:MAG TPA: DNA repair protein RadA, partial [Geminicoccaceae bacterium]|nr:DNA repair protein RadA [Geminicoccaceae bacterium]